MRSIVRCCCVVLCCVIVWCGVVWCGVVYCVLCCVVVWCCGEERTYRDYLGRKAFEDVSLHRGCGTLGCLSHVDEMLQHLISSFQRQRDSLRLCHVYNFVQHRP